MDFSEITQVGGGEPGSVFQNKAQSSKTHCMEFHKAKLVAKVYIKIW